MKMTGHLQLRQPTSQRVQSLAKDWLSVLNQRIRGRIPALVARVRERLAIAVAEATEFEAIRGKYRGEFGLNDAEERIATIVNALCQTVNVVYRPVRGGGAGGVTLYGCPIDNAKLYELAEAYVIDKRETFPWLYAILELGDSIVVADYQYLGVPPLNPSNVGQWSRTELGFMAKAKGRAWRVPPEVSGTPTNNVITRAIATPAFQSFIITELQRLIT